MQEHAASDIIFAVSCTIGFTAGDIAFEHSSHYIIQIASS